MWSTNILQRATVWSLFIFGVLFQRTNAGALPGDPCAALLGKSEATYEQAKACLNHFPFNRQAATETVKTISFVLDKLYAYNEIALAPPAVMNYSLPAVDTLSELQKLLQQDWSTDRAFHDAVDIILERLQDAHTTYHPYCYRQFYFLQPIQLNSIVRNGKQIIQVAWIRTDLFPQAKREWVGCEVTHINDKPALQYVIDYAINVGDGLSKDAHVRFNNLLNSYTFAKRWATSQDRLGMQTRLPESPSIKYTIACPAKTVNIETPWVALLLSDIKSASQYWNSFCKPSQFNTVVKKRDDDLKAPLERWFDHPVNENQLIKRANNTALFTLLTSSKGAQYFKLGGNNADVGVIHLSAFESDDAVLSTFVKALNTFAARNVKKIIFDVSNNGGGSICLGNYITKLIFPTEQQFPSDIKYSDFISRVIEKAYQVYYATRKHVTYFTSLANAKNPLELFQNPSWIKNPLTYTRGGKQVKLSQPVSLYCPPVSSLPPSQQFNNKYWKASDIIIVSNGLCGSTCSIVTTHMREEFGVPTVGLGGIWGQPMAYSSFPGGQVTRFDDFLDDIKDLGLQSDPEAPKPLPLNSALSWAGREAYLTQNLGTPLEYQSFPADCRLPITDDNEQHPNVLWHEVASLLKSGQCPLSQR